jgi:hypothetical protein
MFFNAFLYLNYSCQSLEFDVKRIWELSKKKKKIGGPRLSRKLRLIIFFIKTISFYFLKNIS